MNHEMHNMISEMECMEDIKKTLTSWLKEEVSNGKEYFDTQTCGAVSDIIKDMAETTKECYEACYYKTVIEAMSEDREPVYGYNHMHLNNGQFASSGKGHYVRGYHPGPYMNQMPYIDAYMHDPDFEKHMGGKGHSAMGYDHESRIGNSKDGDIYDNYRNAKRHYQDSKSTKDKETMDEHGMMYMEHTLGNLKTMWKEADPVLKSKMKRDFGDEIAVVLEHV